MFLFLLFNLAFAEPMPDKVATCSACHGPQGISTNDLWPNLAGQKEQYLREQLQAFRSGSRSNSLMSGVARMLTDQDIETLAAYYAHLGKTHE